MGLSDDDSGLLWHHSLFQPHFQNPVLEAGFYIVFGYIGRQGDHMYPAPVRNQTLSIPAVVHAERSGIVYDAWMRI
jgi:hypothetical protein